VLLNVSVFVTPSFEIRARRIAQDQMAHRWQLVCCGVPADGVCGSNVDIEPSQRAHEAFSFEVVTDACIEPIAARASAV
jgi:hypothetical protein